MIKKMMLASLLLLPLAGSVVVSNHNRQLPEDGTKASPDNEGRDLLAPRKAHFRYAGSIVPYTRTVEVAIVYDFAAAISDVRNATDLLDVHVESFIDKFGHGHSDSLALSKLNDRGKASIEASIVQFTTFLAKSIKRGWLDWIGTALSLFQGWSNRNSIQNLRENEDLIHSDVVLNRDYVAKAVNAAQALKQGMVEGLEFQEISTEIKIAHEHLLGGIHDMLDAAYEAAQGRIHRLIAPPETLRDMVTEVMTQANEKNLDLVFSTGAQLLRSPRSILLGSDGMGLVLHVPAVARVTGIMKLYHLDKAEVVHANAVERLRIDKPFLAFDTKGWRVTLTAADLSLCYKTADLFLCYHDRQLRKGTFDCTTAVYDHSRVTDWCYSEVNIYAKGHVVDLGQGYFHGRAPHATMTCRNGASKALNWTKVSTRKVHDICAVDGGDDDFYVQEGHDQDTVTGPTQKFISPRDQVLPIGSVLPGTSSDAVKNVTVAIDIEEVKELHKRQWGTEEMLIVVAVFSGVIVLLFLALIVLWRFARSTKAQLISQLAGLRTTTSEEATMTSAIDASSNLSGDSGNASGTGTTVSLDPASLITNEVKAALREAATTAVREQVAPRMRTSSLTTSSPEEYVLGAAKTRARTSSVRSSSSRTKTPKTSKTWKPLFSRV